MGNVIKIVLFSVWMTIIFTAIYYYMGLGMPLTGVTDHLKVFINRHGAWGPIIYIGVYAFRSLIFFPGSLLAAASGLLFGPIYGIFYTLIGENISANISFLIGRYFGAGIIKYFGSKNRLIPFLECRFRENGFLSVLTMRLLYLPFDLVGYTAGFCSIRPRAFALGTLLGTIPGLSMFVLLGSAITDPKNLILALFIFIFGWTVSRWIKEKTKGQVFI